VVLDVVRKHLQARAANQERTKRKASLHPPSGCQTVTRCPADTAARTTSIGTRFFASDRQMTRSRSGQVARRGAVAPLKRHEHPARRSWVPVLALFRVGPPGRAPPFHLHH